MANRRTINVQISLSEQVAELSEFAQLLYTWAILHADDWGVIHVSARRLKGQVMPLSDRPAVDFESAVNEWVAADLVLGYVHEGERYVLFPTFDQHQTGLDKRTRARAMPHPQHTEGCQNFTCGPRTAEKFAELLGNSALREEKRTEEKRTEGEASPAGDATTPPPDDDADALLPKQPDDLPMIQQNKPNLRASVDSALSGRSQARTRTPWFTELQQATVDYPDDCTEERLCALLASDPPKVADRYPDAWLRRVIPGLGRPPVDFNAPTQRGRASPPTRLPIGTDAEFEEAERMIRDGRA